MSPAGAVQAPARRCPHCGAGLAEHQDWCLECGKEVARPPAPLAPRQRRSWRAPAIAVVALGAVGGALVVAAPQLVGLSGSGSAPAPQTSPAPTPPPAPPARPPAAQVPDDVPTWPDGAESYTVVLLSTFDAEDAFERARSLVRKGADGGVLAGDRYAGFTRGSWIVWRGRYRQQEKAREALALVRRAGLSGEVKYVKPR